jgi:ketosteroid isomerase-like protein
MPLQPTRFRTSLGRSPLGTEKAGRVDLSVFRAISIRRAWSLMLKWQSFVALSLLTSIGCGGAKAPSGAARTEVESATAAFHEALRTNDTDAFMSYVADDVVLMPPGEAAVRGKPAMRAWYATFLSQYRTSSLTLSGRDVVVGEGFAVESGTFEWGLTPVAGGAPVVDRGNYMQVWKRQPDGNWRFEQEIWNSSASAAQPAVK